MNAMFLGTLALIIVQCQRLVPRDYTFEGFLSRKKNIA